MARRLVEMAGYIIMSYLLLQDAKVDQSFINSAKVYVNYTRAEVEKHAGFIANFDAAQLAAYGI